MRLDEWMRRNKVSCAEFARRIDAHRTEVWNYATRRRAPRAARIVAIQKVTRGKVTAADFAG